MVVFRFPCLSWLVFLKRCYLFLKSATTAAPIQLPVEIKSVAEKLMEQVEQLKLEQAQLQLPSGVVPPQVKRKVN
jgi:hypothetical protein